MIRQVPAAAEEVPAEEEAPAVAEAEAAAEAIASSELSTHFVSSKACTKKEIVLT